MTLPGGASPVQGSTLSQVGPVPQSEQDEENRAGDVEPVQSALMSFRTRLRGLRSRLFARRGGRRGAGIAAPATETTPLVSGEQQNEV